MFVVVSRPFFHDFIFYIRLCLGYCYSALCPTVIQTRRTSVCHRITTFLDQRMRNSRSRALVRVYRLGENDVSHSVPVLGPGTIR